eukprot:COSAG03_NODE_2274_length_2927_cov_2.040665_1_plen_58_part_10
MSFRCPLRGSLSVSLWLCVLRIYWLEQVATKKSLKQVLARASGPYRAVTWTQRVAAVL